jgi:hypothetical protein
MSNFYLSVSSKHVVAQRKPLPDPDISPSQTSQLATCDPEREYSNPLDCPGQIATPQRCVLERPLGTQIGLGWGRQNERDRVMVEDPPTDLEEVVGGT